MSQRQAVLNHSEAGMKSNRILDESLSTNVTGKICLSIFKKSISLTPSPIPSQLFLYCSLYIPYTFTMILILSFSSCFLRSVWTARKRVSVWRNAMEIQNLTMDKSNAFFPLASSSCPNSPTFLL